VSIRARLGGAEKNAIFAFLAAHKQKEMQNQSANRKIKEVVPKGLHNFDI